MHLLFFLNFSNNWVFPVEGTWSLHCRGVTSGGSVGPCSCLHSLLPGVGPFAAFYRALPLAKTQQGALYICLGSGGSPSHQTAFLSPGTSIALLGASCAMAGEGLTVEAIV